MANDSGCAGIIGVVVVVWALSQCHSNAPSPPPAVYADPPAISVTYEPPSYDPPPATSD